MTRVPPWVVRRLLLTPLVVAADVAVLVAAAPALLLGVLTLPVAGTRVARITVIVATYAACHLRALAALLWLWLRGCADEAPHYEVMRRFVAGVYDVTTRFARVTVIDHGEASARRALDPGDHPVVLLSRHAGEGDTLLVIHELLCRHGRRPVLVMHEALRLDPLIDVLGTRLGHLFLDPRGGDTEQDIAATASRLDGGSALVIFPEGENFSEASRRRAIDRLLRRGHRREADLARTLQHVIAPRPGGALAAIDGAPHADVVIMGHAGFPTGLGEVWRLLPRRQAIAVAVWHEPAAAVPAGRQERVSWIFERWRELDEWVEKSRGGPRRDGPAPAV